MDMPNFSYNGKEEGWPCPDTHETDEVHNYLKEIRISVDKNIQFCHLKRFKSDTIKLAAQESGKKLQSTPADQAVEKKLKATPADQESGKKLQSKNLIKTITGPSNSDVSPLANDGSPTSSKTSISIITKKEYFVLVQDFSDDESHSAIPTLGIPQPSHSAKPTNPKLPLVNRLTKRGFIQAKNDDMKYNRYFHMDPKCPEMSREARFTNFHLKLFCI